MAWARPRNGATQDRRGRVDGWLSWELLVSDLDKDLRILPIHARCFSNRHLIARPLSVPADIPGGDAVAVAPSPGLNDALSVRSKPCTGADQSSQAEGRRRPRAARTRRGQNARPTKY